ncbi:MAG TPA: cell surface protein [Verrucomicrobiae bacterium]|nr:cell surface protein [Verrucomicrobiae bacterium]
MKRILTNMLLALVLVCGLNYTARPDRTGLRDLILTAPGLPPLSPAAMLPSVDGRELFLACQTANQVAVYDIERRSILRRIDVPASPSGLALSRDGRQLYVTCSAPRSKICVISTAEHKIRTTFSAGHTAMAPVLSPDGTLLYVCDRFNDAVEVLDAVRGKSLGLIRVDREPVAASLSPDGKLLFVANHIHSGRSDQGVVAASVSVIDTAKRKLVKNVPLTNGSGLLRGICVSPDGKYVAVTHILARFHLPTTTVQHGWMNDNALSLIDASQLELLATVLLDQDNLGAANPWAIQWAPDGKLICVAHAGTHEVSMIDAGAMLSKICNLPPLRDASVPQDITSNAARARSEIPNDLEFLSGIRTRFKLHVNGPRSMAIVGKHLFVAGYFSDSLCVLNLDRAPGRSATIALESPPAMAKMRKGEMYFNDGTLCYEGWQSCASCHSSDARVDGMNWDLLNDGMGNPKNVRSLLLSFQTPPVMSMGVRSDAAAAIRAGMRHILFTTPREEIASAIDEYVKNLQPSPSPFLVHNRLSPAAERGQKIFFSQRVGCSVCHKPPFFTDLKPHAIGTGKFDQSTDEFYTPALAELWRTAPYLHDGSAATLRDVVLSHGPQGKQAGEARLTSDQVDDLVAFLQSL